MTDHNPYARLLALLLGYVVAGGLIIAGALGWAVLIAIDWVTLPGGLVATAILVVGLDYGWRLTRNLIRLTKEESER